jgi:ribonuclease P protein component
VGCIVARLKRRHEFLKVAASRRKWVTSGFILQARSHDDDDDFDGDDVVRVGFTVSRRIGNAVARNRARRRLKAAAAEVMKENARPGFDYVVIGRATALTRPFRTLVDDFKIALKRLDAGADAPAPSGKG